MKNMKTWQLQDAKAQFSKVVKSAIDLGPQGISVRGNLEAVLVSKEKYKQLTEKKKIKNFNDFIDQSPLKGLDLDIKRDRTLVREIKLFED